MLLNGECLKVKGPCALSDVCLENIPTSLSVHTFTINTHGTWQMFFCLSDSTNPKAIYARDIYLNQQLLDKGLARQ